MKVEEKKALIDYLNINKGDVAKYFNKTTKDVEDFIALLEGELIRDINKSCV